MTLQISSTSDNPPDNSGGIWSTLRSWWDYYQTPCDDKSKPGIVDTMASFFRQGSAVIDDLGAKLDKTEDVRKYIADVTDAAVDVVDAAQHAERDYRNFVANRKVVVEVGQRIATFTDAEIKERVDSAQPEIAKLVETQRQSESPAVEDFGHIKFVLGTTGNDNPLALSALKFNGEQPSVFAPLDGRDVVEGTFGTDVFLNIAGRSDQDIKTVVGYTHGTDKFYTINNKLLTQDPDNLQAESVSDTGFSGGPGSYFYEEIIIPGGPKTWELKYDADGDEMADRTWRFESETFDATGILLNDPQAAQMEDMPVVHPTITLPDLPKPPAPPAPPVEGPRSCELPVIPVTYQMVHDSRADIERAMEAQQGSATGATYTGSIFTIQAGDHDAVLDDKVSIPEANIRPHAANMFIPLERLNLADGSKGTDVFTVVTDALPQDNRVIIHQFETGNDKITAVELGGLDQAQSVRKGVDFSGTGDFTGTKGEWSFSKAIDYYSSQMWDAFYDRDGDGQSDYHVKVKTNQHDLSEADFLLAEKGYPGAVSPKYAPPPPPPPPPVPLTLEEIIRLDTDYIRLTNEEQQYSDGNLTHVGQHNYLIMGTQEHDHLKQSISPNMKDLPVLFVGGDDQDNIHGIEGQTDVVVHLTGSRVFGTDKVKSFTPGEDRFVAIHPVDGKVVDTVRDVAEGETFNAHNQWIFRRADETEKEHFFLTNKHTHDNEKVGAHVEMGQPNRADSDDEIWYVAYDGRDKDYAPDYHALVQLNKDTPLTTQDFILAV